MSEEENKGFKVIDRRGFRGTEKTEKAEPEKKAEGEGFVMREAPAEAPPPPDQIDFSTLVFSIATGAFIHLGLAPDPVTQKTEKNLPLAKHNIDLLSLLREKTKGNLTSEEDQLLGNILTELKLRYVEAAPKKG